MAAKKLTVSTLSTPVSQAGSREKRHRQISLCSFYNKDLMINKEHNILLQQYFTPIDEFPLPCKVSVVPEVCQRIRVTLLSPVTKAEVQLLPGPG